ncbi:MAG: DUF4349 domain-containing protein [Bacteroidales bacterium]|nr:DUF4349 domain-containing protein [Bacteroidales bacterium]
MKRTWMYVFVMALMVASCSQSVYKPSLGSAGLSPISGGVPAQYGDAELYKSNKINENKARKQEKASQSRVVIYNAYLHLVAEHPDTVNDKLAVLAKKYEGYTQTLGTGKSVIRVKAEYLKDAVENITKLGKVKSKRISGDDVTAEYRDNMIRLENAMEARKKYLDLLGKAETVEEMLKVEKELERLNKEIDLIKGRLNRMQHLSDYSTITVYIKEKKKPGILGYIGLGLYHSVKWLFVRN